jgi:hypothetical protein
LSPTNPYLASSWLSFLTKDKNNDFKSNLGKFKVPLFLRNFPTSPTMIAQNGNASKNQASSIDFNTLLNWDYSIKYSESFHFPQDILSFIINFNIVKQRENRFSAIEDAFPQLSEFITVFPEVDKALNSSLASIDATTTDAEIFEKANIALTSFNQMVSNIIMTSNAAFTMPAPMALYQSNAVASPYLFALSEGKALIGAVDALIISIDNAVPEGISPPIVSLDLCTTYPYTEKCVGAYCYYFKDAEGKIVSATDGQQKPNRTIILPGMNILARQDVETSVELKRNVELVPGKKSAEPFIYTTGKVGFSNYYFPTISNNSKIEISLINAPSGNNNTTTLNNQLTNLFNALLAKNTQPVLYFQMNCSYSFSINAQIGNIILPVLMQPIISVEVDNQEGADTKLDQLITNWSSAIKLWFTNYQPNESNASFNFNLTVFSNLTENPLPLVKLESLMLDVIYITDL